MSDGFLFVRSDVDDAGLSAAEFRVLGHLARRAGKDGWIYSAVDNMAKVCRLHKKTVRVILRELEARKILKTEPRPGLTSHRRINPPSDWTANPSQSDTLPNPIPYPQNGKGVLPKGYPTPLPNGYRQRKSPQGSPKKGNPLLAEFEFFFEIYPRQEDKAEACKLWQKVKPPFQEVMEALKWQIPYWKDGYEPGPVKYIRGKKWEDKPSKGQRRSLVNPRDTYNDTAAWIFANDNAEGFSLEEIKGQITSISWISRVEQAQKKMSRRPYQARDADPLFKHKDPFLAQL